MVWRIGVKGFELVGVLDGAELGDIEGAIGVQLDAEHVVDADERDHGPEQLRALRQNSAHEQAAVAAAHDGQLVRVGVLLVDQVLGAGNEVVEDVLLLGEVAGPVPILAELAAAAEVGDGVDAALLQPDLANHIEARHLAAAVAAVAVENRWVLAVEFCVLLLDDVERNPRAVLRDGDFANHLAIAEVGRRRAEEFRLLHLAGARVE